MTSQRRHQEPRSAAASLRSTRGVLAALGLLTLAALALRCGGLAFGLPLLSNPYVRPDESLLVVAAVRMLEGAADPHLTVYPGLFPGLCAVVFGVYHHLSAALGAVAAPGVALDFGCRLSPYFLLARLVSALSGALTVPLVFVLGRRLGSPAAGLAAAGLYAAAPLAVRDAHFGVTDTLTALLTTSAVCLLVAAATVGGRGLLITGGAVLGLAVGCKYSALGLLPVLLLVCLVPPVPWRARLLWGLAALAAMAVAFTLCNPYVLVRPGEYWGAVRGSAGFIYALPSTVGAVRLAVAQVLHPLRYGPGGYAGLALALAGAWWCLGRGGGTPRRLLVCAAGLALLPAVSGQPTIFFRYVIPALPLLAVLAGLGSAALAGAIPDALRLPAWVLLLALCLVPTTLCSLRLDQLLARADTRTLTGDWLRAHVAPGEPVVLCLWPEAEPQLPETLASLARRCAYAASRYGPGPAAVINQLYDLQRAALPGGGYELLRGPAADLLPDRPFALVLAAYPAVTPPPLPRVLAGGRHTVLPLFQALGVRGGGRLDRDPLDAFFLPFGGLDRVLRPGPNLFVYRVTPAHGGGRR